MATSDNLAFKLRDPNRILLTLPLLRQKIISKKISPKSDNIELQLTGSQTCNLHCWYCSTRRWGSGKNKTQSFFPPKNLKKLKIFQPKAIILSGGEPTLYQPTKSFGFNQAILTMAKIIPGVKFGLITNGTIFPSGSWTKHCQWLRISLDAGSSKTYLKLKGANLFDTVLKNFKNYLKSDIPYVGLGYVYQKDNIDEIFDFLKYIYSTLSISDLKKVSIQFRPIIYYPKYLPTKNQIKSLKTKMTASLDLGIKKFSSHNTNLYSIFSPKNKNKPSLTNFCYLSRVHKAINSNGDIFPCCLTFKNKQLSLANISSNTAKEIAHNELSFFNKSPCINNCRLIHKNSLLDTNLKSKSKINATSFICPHFF